MVNAEETVVSPPGDIFLLFEGGGETSNVSNVVGSVVSGLLWRLSEDMKALSEDALSSSLIIDMGKPLKIQVGNS